MKNGMLAKSCSVSMMNLAKTRLCLGSDAVRIQLEQARKEQSRLEQEIISFREAVSGGQ